MFVVKHLFSRISHIKKHLLYVITDLLTFGIIKMASLSSQQEIFHISNRLTFGMTAKDINDINQQGIKNFITAQLNFNTTNLQKYLIGKISEYEGLKMTVEETFKNYNLSYISPKNNLADLSPEERKIWKQKRKKIGQNTLKFKIDKSITNADQLNELMTDFWLNHFNIFIDKHSESCFLYV